ncbi:hypothetical protein Q7P37_005551 [Cladosporium fusiforme]
MAAEGSTRTYLYDSHGPRAVDAGQTRGASRRHHKDTTAEDRDAKRTHKGSGHKSSSKPESSHRRKSSNTQPSSKTPARPTWELDVIGQPHRVVPLGMEVEASVMVSLRFPTADRATEAANIDTSRLVAVASLVADTRSGDRVPVESGLLTGQQLFDSVHDIPQEHVETMERNQPCRVVLGYFTFPGLTIRQVGVYRIRTTLLQMSGSGTSQQGGTAVLAVDSDSVKVERRPSNPQRAQLRAHV